MDLEVAEELKSIEENMALPNRHNTTSHRLSRNLHRQESRARKNAVYREGVAKLGDVEEKLEAEAALRKQSHEATKALMQRKKELTSIGVKRRGPGKASRAKTAIYSDKIEAPKPFDDSMIDPSLL